MDFINVDYSRHYSAAAANRRFVASNSIAGVDRTDTRRASPSELDRQASRVIALAGESHNLRDRINHLAGARLLSASRRFAAT